MTHHSSFHGPRIGGILLLGLMGVAVLATGGVAAQQNVATGDLAGEGTESNPYVITTAAELQAIEDDLNAHYMLGNNIDATQTSKWNNGKGFDPIGTEDSAFTGSLDGSYYTVTGLTINRSDEEHVGFFGVAGAGAVVRNVSLTNTTINGDSHVGSLVGKNTGSIETVTAAGTVTGSDYVGSLVGRNSGSIKMATATGTVTGSDSVGGVVGDNSGKIEMATATGTVTGSDETGGLVGDSNGGIVEDAYWDTETTDQTDSAGGGTGLTTAEMTGSTAKTNMSLAFGSVWETQPVGYPVLTPLTSDEYLVYFTEINEKQSVNGSTGIGNASVDELKSHANSTQKSFKEFASTTPYIEIKNSNWLVNSLLVEVKMNQISLKNIKSIDNVTYIQENERIKITTPGEPVAIEEGNASAGDEDTGSEGPPSTADIRRILSFVSPTTTSTPELEDAVSDTGEITVVPANTETVNSVTFARDDLSGSLQITEYSDPVPQIRDQVTASIVAAGAVNSSNKSTESDHAVDVVSVANISLPADPKKENPATVTLSAPQNVVENPQDLTIIKTTYDFDAQEPTWSQLETSIKRTSGDTITVSAQVDRFSLFVLCEVDQQRSSQTATDTSGDQPSETADHSGSGGFVGGEIVLVVVVAAAVVYQRRK